MSIYPRIALFGFILCASSLWGGSYVVSKINRESWQHFPMVFTFGILFVIGVAVFVAGMNAWGDEDKEKKNEDQSK
jgi:hypothetical protein